MKNTTTYLLPIWIDLEHDNPEAIMMTLNDALTDFLRNRADRLLRSDVLLRYNGRSISI